MDFISKYIFMKEEPASGIMIPQNPGARFYIGLGIFILSFFMLPTGLFLQRFAETHIAKHLIVGIFWISAPLMKISSVAVLGKPSYLYIKSIFRIHVIRVIKPYHASRLRYNIGLFLFFIPVIPTYIMAYAPQFFSDNFYLRLILNISVDVVFITSLFVLGGDFWDKLKALFIFSSKATFPEEETEEE
jgi:hypothetical protein